MRCDVSCSEHPGDPRPSTLSATDLALARRSFRRQAAKALVLRLGALPIAMLCVLLLMAGQIGDEVLSFMWPIFLVAGALLFVLAVAEWVSDARSVFRDDPLLLAAELLRPPQREDLSSRVVEGFSARLTIDVLAAFRVSESGCVTDATANWAGVQDIRSWGGVGRRLRPGTDLVLVCSAKGAAHNRLVELVRTR